MLLLLCGLLRMRGPGRAVWGGSRMRGCSLGLVPVPVLCGPPVALLWPLRVRPAPRLSLLFALRVACLAAEGVVCASVGWWLGLEVVVRCSLCATALLRVTSVWSRSGVGSVGQRLNDH